MALLRHLATLLCAVIHGARPAAAQNRTAIVDYPARVEFNVVFPRNETYAPAPIFPIIFAIQNYAAAAVSSTLEIDWSIREYVSGRYVTHGIIHMDDIDPHHNTTAPDPYYAVVWTSQLNATAAPNQYALSWEFSHVSCSGAVVAAYPADFNTTSHGGYYDVFTLATTTNAKQPDVGADLHTCPGWYSAAFEINGTTPVLQPPKRSQNDGRDVCAVVSEAPPPGDPCAVRIGEAAAASISARMTAEACAQATPMVTSGCPPPLMTETGTNLGLRVSVGGGGFGMGLTGALSCVWALAGFGMFLVL